MADWVGGGLGAMLGRPVAPSPTFMFMSRTIYSAEAQSG